MADGSCLTPRGLHLSFDRKIYGKSHKSAKTYGICSVSHWYGHHKIRDFQHKNRDFQYKTRTYTKTPEKCMKTPEKCMKTPEKCMTIPEICTHKPELLRSNIAKYYNNTLECVYCSPCMWPRRGERSFILNFPNAQSQPSNTETRSQNTTIR